jgi:hypothetical protein
MAKVQLAIVLHVSDSPVISEDQLAVHAIHFFSSLKRWRDQNLLSKITLHLTGRFIEIAKKHCPKEVASLKEWIISEDMEILGGGFYDPVFPLIPESSSKAQIFKLESSILSAWNVRPRGFWLPSFVFETSMISLLNSNSYEYVVLKDYQLEGSLIRQTRKKGYWTLEDRTDVIRVISSSHEVSENFRLQKVKQFFKSVLEDSPDQEVTVLDIPFFRSFRGEYEKEKFDFLEELIRNSNKYNVEFQFKTLANIIDKQPSRGAINLPSTVGKNLGLPDNLSSVRDLLIIQPECNFLHKKMLYVAKKADAITDPKIRDQVISLILPAQRVFYYRNQDQLGGIRYLQDRAQCFEYLLQAETLIRESSNAQGLKIEITDFLANGSKQLLCSNDQVGFLLEHRTGGRIRSLEYRPLDLNLINGFHQSEPIGQMGRIYSVDPVSGLRDRILGFNENDLKSLKEILKSDTGLLNGPFEYQIKKQKDRGQIVLSGEQSGFVGGQATSLHVDKVLSLKDNKNELLVGFQITNATFNLFEGFFGTELNLSFKNFDKKNQYILINDQKSTAFSRPSLYSNVESFEYRSALTGMLCRWEFIKQASLCIIPVLSKALESNDQNGFQCLKLFAFWPAMLKGQESSSFHSRIILKQRRLFK